MASSQFLCTKTSLPKIFENHNFLRISKIPEHIHRNNIEWKLIRFQQTKCEICLPLYKPTFNVLPLILKHFESRYSDQKWIVYDLKRNFGLFYNLQETSYIIFNFKSKDQLDPSNSSIYSTSEIGFQQLWREYFESTNIKSRKNMKLHMQHVPKRYWKYLTEKSTWQN